MSERMDIDLDDAQFDDFQFGTEDILQLENEVQQTQAQQKRNNDHDNWNPAQDVLMATQSFLAQASQREEEQEPIAEEPEATAANTSRFGPEADRVIQELQFQLRRLEVNTSNYNEYPRSKEVNDLKQALQNKESYIKKLHTELSRFRSQETDTQKRIFPGPPTKVPKQTKRRTISSQVGLRTTLTQSSIFSNQSMRSGSVAPISNTLKQAKSTNVERSSSPLIISEQNLASIKSRPISTAAPFEPPPPPPSSIPNKVERFIKPVSIPVEEEESDDSTPIRLKRPKKKTFGKLFDNELSETHRNRKLLIVLFTPAFQKWNIEQHRNQKDINMCLFDKQRVEYFSTAFSQEFIPEQGQCSSIALDNMKLLASDIRSYLVKSEYADGTIRLLLNVFNLCMPICITERLYVIMQHIINIVNTLAISFPVVTKYLHRDFTFDANSLLTQFVKTLALFPLRDVQPPQVIVDHPDIENKSFGEIKHVVENYSSSPSQITKSLHTKAPKEEPEIIKSILDLFYCVGSKFKKPTFARLMTDRTFMNLLAVKRQYDIVIRALQVLENNFQNDDWVSLYKDEQCGIVLSLSKLLLAKQGSMTREQWYIVRTKSMTILKKMCFAKELPATILENIQKEVFTKVNKFFDDIYDFIQPRQVNINDSCRTATDSIRNALDDIITLGLTILYMIMESYPKNIFELTNISANKCQLLVDSFQDLPTEHPAHPVLTKMETPLKRYAKKKRN